MKNLEAFYKLYNAQEYDLAFSYCVATMRRTQFRMLARRLIAEAYAKTDSIIKGRHIIGAPAAFGLQVVLFDGKCIVDNKTYTSQIDYLTKRFDEERKLLRK